MAKRTIGSGSKVIIGRSGSTKPVEIRSIKGIGSGRVVVIGRSTFDKATKSANSVLRSLTKKP